MRSHRFAGAVAGFSALVLAGLTFPVAALAQDDPQSSPVGTSPQSSTSPTAPEPQGERAPDTAAPVPGATPVAPVTRAAGTVDIDVYNITDLHGHLERVVDAKSGAVVDPGGVVLACEIKRARDANPAMVLTSSGDSISGSPYASAILKDEPTLDYLNAVGMQVSALGNHEFDRGSADLEGRVLPKVAFPYLGVNVDGSAAIDAEGSGKGYWLTEVSGVTVGFVGATTAETPTMVAKDGIPGITFDDAAERAQAKAVELKDGNPANGEADVVVVLIHDGMDVWKDSFGPEVDAVFGGHTHVDGTEKATVKGEDQARMQTDEYGRRLGHVRLSHDTATGATTVALLDNKDLATSDCTQDAYGAEAIITKMVDDSALAGEKPVGRINSDLLRGANDGVKTGDNRGTESSASNFIAESFRWWLAANIKPDGERYIGIMNPGGVRADYLLAKSGAEAEDGIVTFAEAFRVQPFGNQMAYKTLTGEQLAKVLAQQFQPGASRPVLMLGTSDNVEVFLDQEAADTLHELHQDIKSGTAPADADARVAAARAKLIRMIRVDGKELRKADTVVVASNDFLLAGNDGFTALGDAGKNTNTGVIDLDATSAYLADSTVPVRNHAAKHQYGVTYAANSDGTPGYSLALTGLAMSVATEAQPRTLAVAGETPAAVDLTPVANGPETGKASLRGTVQPRAAFECEASASRWCTTITVDLLLADGSTFHSLAVPVETLAPTRYTVSVDKTRVRPGEKITFTAAGFLPRERIVFRVHSTPINAGVVEAGADGVAGLTWAVPADMEVGTHEVAALATSGGAETTFEVVAGETPAPHPSTPGTPKTPGAPKGSGALAKTGADMLPIVGTAVVALTAGILLVLRRRMR
ncbi:bifunctional metallophosphatase/5'-nucleotidase [Schaalia sp. 19OD2882]|uniref:bifunctional metallophosphatase/5'-nucleotidase n=1 Tax=Schaalia sp. 19OD2882 TaxID=2794089 RepID=UPI001C1EBFA0|nr:bifunctional UDP-sugar hydrolase/5'-nucleotidase [Schaalia sp. 19OD2882]QWW18718.1 bifunctional metallophosphatase/5'-nucleotidase [Schaalia sp. 19OD2882]